MTASTQPTETRAQTTNGSFQTDVSALQETTERQLRIARRICAEREMFDGGGGSERPACERRRGRSGRPTAPSDLCSAQLLGGRRGDRDRGRLLASADPLRAPPALLPWGVDVSHDRGCRRCHRPHSAFRVQRGFDWLPVCRDCLETWRRGVRRSPKRRTRRRRRRGGVDVNLTHSTGGFYDTSVSQTNQKSKATNKSSHRRGEGVDSPSGFTHLTLLSRRNKPTAHGQRELPFCAAARRSTGGGSVDLWYPMKVPSVNLTTESASNPAHVQPCPGMSKVKTPPWTRISPPRLVILNLMSKVSKVIVYLY